MMKISEGITKGLRLASRGLRAAGRTRRAVSRLTFSPRSKRRGDYPGDYHGVPELRYGPIDDDLPQTGEMMWAWVPFEEDHSKGKDRPLLIVGMEDGWVLAVPATSKDHDLDAEQERDAGRYWIDIGSGEWDSKRRPTEVRLDRIVRIRPSEIRRLAGRIDEKTFDAVAEGIRRHWAD